MRIKSHFPGILVPCSFLMLCCCGHRQKAEVTHFTKADSLTETYLDLKDSMLETWNTMIHDDNQKIRAMKNLLHELEVSNTVQTEELKTFESRLEHLVASRYMEKLMEDPQVIEEYDFASNSIISELISLAESQSEFAYNPTLQKLVETIRSSDQRVNSYRLEYDRIASTYNRFIDKNKDLLKDIGENEKRPLFRMVADE